MTLEDLESPLESALDSHLGRPLRADAERNRRRILAAAAEVFAKRGLEAGLDEIARHAGVGTGTVYRRFPDKTMLIEALFESRLDDLIALAGRAAAEPDAWAGLVHFLLGSIEMQQADRGLKDLLFGEGSAAPVSDRFTDKRDQLVPAVTALVDRAKASGQMRADVSVTDLAVVQFMLHGVGAFSASVEPELWRRQFGLILDGLRADGPGRVNTPLPLEPVTEEQLEFMCRAGN
jgi:AcrR family transcriptional regulator